MLQKWLRIWVVLGLAICTVFWPVQPSFACDCPTRIPARDALADSHAVFVGTVTQIVGPQPSLQWTRSFPFLRYDTPAYAPLTITLAVDQFWRGPPYRSITLTTGQAYSQCGVPFQQGQQYLVYAYRNAVGDLVAHRCSRTVPIAQSRDDLAIFGAGTVPTQATPDPPPSSAALLAALCSIMLMIACVGAGGLFLRRRSRRSG